MQTNYDSDTSEQNSGTEATSNRSSQLISAASRMVTNIFPATSRPVWRYRALVAILSGVPVMELMYALFATYTAHDGFEEIDKSLFSGFIKNNVPAMAWAVAGSTAALDYFINVIMVLPQKTARKQLQIDANLNPVQPIVNPDAVVSPEVSTSLDVWSKTLAAAHFAIGAVAPTMGIYYFIPTAIPALQSSAALLNTTCGGLSALGALVGLAYYYGLSWNDVINATKLFSDKKNGPIQALKRIDRRKWADAFTVGFIFNGLLRGASFAFILEEFVGFIYYMTKSQGVNPLQFLRDKKSNPYPLNETAIWLLRAAGFLTGLDTSIRTRGLNPFQIYLKPLTKEQLGQLITVDLSEQLKQVQLQWKDYLQPLIYASSRGGFPAYMCYGLVSSLLMETSPIAARLLGVAVGLIVGAPLAGFTYNVQLSQMKALRARAMLDSSNGINQAPSSFSTKLSNTIAHVSNIGSQTNRLLAGVLFLVSSILKPLMELTLSRLLSEEQILFIAVNLALMMTIELQISNGMYFIDKAKSGVAEIASKAGGAVTAITTRLPSCQLFAQKPSESAEALLTSADQQHKGLEAGQLTSSSSTMDEDAVNVGLLADRLSAAFT